MPDRSISVLASRPSRLVPAACLALSALLPGCGGMGPRAAAPAPGPKPVASAPAPTPAAQVPATPIGDLKLSNVTLRGLESIGIKDTPGIVEWFNSLPGTDDPFLAPMEAELDSAPAAAERIEDLKLSSVTVDALKSLDVTAPAGIPGIDRKKLKDSRKPFDLCRNEIAAAMQKTGWTVLRANVSNPAGASALTVNGELIGPISKGAEPVWRRMLVRAPGNDADRRVIATLGVEVPSPATGLPSARWFRDIELERGGETRIEVEVREAPAPSIGFAPKNPLSPAAVYAGDSVALTCEGGNAETVWFAIVPARRLSASNYQTKPSSSDPLAGLPAWFRLRTVAEAAAGPRDSLLAEPPMVPVVIGRGASMEWRPQFETPAARIGVLVRGASGFWGYAERTIAVADVRPGVWVMPALPVDAGSAATAALAAGAVEPSPDNIYLTHAILSELVYVAGVGAESAFEFRRDEYRDASLPVSGMTIDFGDGSAVANVDQPSQGRPVVRHAYASAGDYRVTVTTTDVMGFRRTHGTNVSVRAEAPPPPPAPPAPAAARRVVTATVAESSFDLFRRAAEQFARTASARTAPYWGGKRLGLAHIHDAKDQDLVDLMDSTLVRSLLAAGAQVYEREPVYQLAIDARGFVDSSKEVVPPQGGKVPDALLQRAANAEEGNPAASLKLLDRIGAAPVPEVDVVLEYKLKRAEVSVVPAGAMVIRTARIFAWLRVQERGSMRILFDDEVQVALGGTIVAAEAGGAGLPWDSYPDGFMLHGGSDDKAIEKREEREEPAGAAGAKVDPKAPQPADPKEKAGGMIEGLFGR